MVLSRWSAPWRPPKPPPRISTRVLGDGIKPSVFIRIRACQWLRSYFYLWLCSYFLTRHLVIGFWNRRNCIGERLQHGQNRFFAGCAGDRCDFLAIDETE